MRNMWKNTDSKVLMEQKCEYNNSFDLVKFWCSYIVISIHCGLKNGITPPISQIVNLVQYMAVPIFYVISGYLLGCKLYGANKANSWHSSVKTLLWQIKLYVIWAVLFLPINLYGEFFVYKHNVCQSVVSLLQGWFLVGENYDSWPLWYLLSSIVGMGLVFILLSTRHKEDVYSVAFHCCLCSGYGCHEVTWRRFCWLATIHDELYTW